MPVNPNPWPNGTPAWVDLSVPDLEAAKAFYAGLFEWEFQDGGEETGHYTTALKDGEPVAAVAPTMPGQEAAPSSWTTYLAVDDVDTTVERIGPAGGRVVMPPMQVMEFGSMAIAADPSGAVFGLWQSGSHTGVNRYNEHGALIWNEALVRDFEAAQGFYADVFGWEYDLLSDAGVTYATIKNRGETVGGMGDASQLLPPDAPSRWGTYFAVDDIGDTVSKVASLGGTVVREPWTSGFGTMAVVQGPAGETFSLNQPEAAQG